MKKRLILLSIFCILLFTSIHAQSLGFAETECGVVANSNYYYENWQSGSHTAGYKLYHNGVIIRSEYSEMYGFSAVDLKFINDTIGYFVVFEAWPKVIVYKIVGDKLTKIGSEIGVYLASYIVNPYTIYIAINLQHISLNTFIRICKYSDIQPAKVLISDTTFIANITENDTIIGSPSCDNLPEINYKHSNGSDTLIYKILLNVIDSSYSIMEKSLTKWKVFPNPADDYIYLKPYIQTNQFSLKLFDNLGILKKSETFMTSDGLSIYVGELNSGIYFGQIIQDKEYFSFKLIKK